MGSADVRVMPHRVVAPAKLKAIGGRGMYATAPAAPSAIPRMTTTEIIARARKQVQQPHEPRRATTGGLRPVNDRADVREIVAKLWRELNKLTGTTAAPPDATPVASLHHAVKRLRAAAEKLEAQRTQHRANELIQAEDLAKAQSKHAEMIETARKLEEQIRSERQQAQDNQKAVRAVLQENEQLRQDLFSTQEELQRALQSASLVGRGIEEEGSDFQESSSSSSCSSRSSGGDGFDETNSGQDGHRVQSERQRELTFSSNDNITDDMRHSVATTSGAALLTETTRAAKDGERMRLRTVEQRLEDERTARKRAEDMIEDAEDETQAVQRLRQIETEQWAVELERVEAAAKDQIDRLAEEREEARETAMLLQGDLQHERKQNIGANTSFC